MVFAVITNWASGEKVDALFASEEDAVNFILASSGWLNAHPMEWMEVVPMRVL
jgi:hypothetical protein